ATAPTENSPAVSARTSALRSKSASWTETEVFILAPRHRRKEGNLVAILDLRGQRHHVLVDRGAQILCAVKRNPLVATRSEMVAQGGHRRHSRGQCQGFRGSADRLAQTGEKQN